MNPTDHQIQTSLNRLIPRLEERFSSAASRHPQAWNTFLHRLEQHFPRLFDLYFRLYADQYDFFFHLEDLLVTLANMWLSRPKDLQELDTARESDPAWFQSNQMLGAVCYVDLFAGDIQGIKKKILYFKELKVTYLHLMPLFRTPKGESDGGYAVSSYREVNPDLGTMAELNDLAGALRQSGISLVLDLVFNHTSNEHDWALKAAAGEREYQDFFRMFPDRVMPDEYEQHLREIFPDEHQGAFTYSPEIGKWVWTTFHAYQWDLNYANPEVFNRMAEEMLFLANNGVEVLRLDAVAFIWKQLGTNCENLPQAHWIIQAFNAVARIAAPTLLFKSEAIVHPDEVAKYIHPDECQLSYNPLLMALLWDALATRETKMLNQALRERFSIHPGCAWINYVRVHDDIGWTFSDDDASRLGVNGYDHRKFLNSFYTGRFEGSFARGLPFQENPKTGDVRISGTCASLAGLEKALLGETAAEVELGIRRILLIHGVILTIGGIPLIYMGDEIGRLNDYSYREDPNKADDSRWVHRSYADWGKYALRKDLSTVEGRIYQGLQRLISLRLEYPVFAGGEMHVIDTGSPHALGYARVSTEGSALIFANFSEKEVTLPANLFRIYGMSSQYRNLLTDTPLPPGDVHLSAYDFLVVSPD